jgi:beta-ureidopropionase / N-carbamoyl-L-amino-acid hydrolase
VTAPELEKRVTSAVDAQMALVERFFSDLRVGTRDGEGVTRASYGAGEQLAHDVMRQIAVTNNLEISTDAAGNLYATLPGRDRQAPRWISGSHLDSVPQGGNYDGAAGAIAALAALVALKDLGFQPARDLTAMAIRAEECSSWFSGHHGGHLGSRAALGLLKPDELQTAIHVSTGQTLGQSIAESGFDVEAVRRGPAFLSPRNVQGFIELHIEQGPVLVHDKLSIGIVTSIRGTLRAREACCIGAYSHSGAVPQELRQDAVLAVAELIHRLDEACTRVRSDGNDIVFTVGKIHTDAKVDSLSKVPGEVRFTIDVRSQEIAILTQVSALLDEFSKEIAVKRNVRFELGRRTLSEPTLMDRSWRSHLITGASRLGIVARELPCGAGHDAADFVRAHIPSCMIFVRNTGDSHNPSEHMELSDFRDGLRLLTWFLATVSVREA